MNNLLVLVETERKANSISNEDLAWAAGIFEADGSFSTMKAKRTMKDGTQRTYIYPVIQLANTDPLIVEAIQQIFKMGKINPNSRTSRNRPYYRWRLLGGRAKHVYRLILPFIKGKKREVIKYLLSV